MLSLVLLLLLATVTLTFVIRAQVVCSASTPSSGAYVVNLCVTEPGHQVTVSGPFVITATASVTGSNPGVQRMVFTLDGQYLLTDYAAPYSFELPASHFVDGPHTVGVVAHMRDGFVTAELGAEMTLVNGVTAPPVNNNQFVIRTGMMPPAGQPLVIATTGDGAGGRPESTAVTDQILAWNPGLFLYLGDVYAKGTYTEFHNWYGTAGRFFGRLKSITNPIIGNHEYENGVAPGYFDYWDNIPNYYSYDAAGWHFIALNSTSQFGQTTPGSAQYQWLANDLVASSSPCSVAYFHHPVFSVGPQGDTPAMNSIWALLADRGVDIVLTGHDHHYQRWIALDGSGIPSSSGVTQFVVGGGGHGVQAFVRSDGRMAQGYDTIPNGLGALRLELNPAGAAFRYVNMNGVLLDSGVIPCSGAGPDTVAPGTPAIAAATPNMAYQVQLVWNPVYDNTGVAGYHVYRDGQLLATVDGAATAYQDVATQLNAVYVYTLQAFDPAGNLSALSEPVSVTTAGDGLYHLTPSADAYVSGANPTTNYGTATMLRTDLVPEQQSYLRFSVPPLSGVVVAATLRVYANSSSSAGYRLRQVASNSWGEKTINYNNRPALGADVGGVGPFSSNMWTTVDVTGLIAGAGDLSLALATGVDVATSYSSREGANPPELVIQVAAPGTPTPIPSATPSATPTLIPSPTPTEVPSATPTPIPSPTPTEVPSATPTLVPTATPAPSETPSPPAPPTETPTLTPTVEPTATPLPTNTPTATPAPTATPSPTLAPTPEGGLYRLTPVADAYVNGTNPAANYGVAIMLRTDLVPEQHSYLRFEVPPLASAVVNATLRVYANSSSSAGYELRAVADNSWGERTLTYNNRPAFGPEIGRVPAFSPGTWTAVDVTGQITGPGEISFALTTGVDVATSYSSREGANPAELVIQVAGPATPTPVPSDTPTPTVSPTATATASPTVAPTETPQPTVTPPPPPTATPAPTAVPTDTPAPTATPTLPPTPTATPGLVNHTFVAMADSYVNQNQPDKNYGRVSSLRTDGSPIMRSYLRFDVQGLAGAVVSARLRLYANSNASTGYEICLVADNSWSELLITFQNAPSFGSVVAVSGPISANAWKEVDITGLVSGNGSVSLVLKTTSTTAGNFASRESFFPPELVIVTTGTGP